MRPRPPSLILFSVMLLKRSAHKGDRLGFVLAFSGVTFTLATCLTLFYFAHEQLPRFARAPSALILAPIALVDGLCYAAGISGIYGKTVPIFIVNSLFAAILCALCYCAWERWGRRNI